MRGDRGRKRLSLIWLNASARPMIRRRSSSWATSWAASSLASRATLETGSGQHRQFTMLLARGSHGNLHILSHRCEKLHEAFHGKGSRAVAHERRDVGLLDTQYFSSFGLLKAPSFNKPVNLEREA